MVHNIYSYIKKTRLYCLIKYISFGDKKKEKKRMTANAALIFMTVAIYDFIRLIYFIFQTVPAIVQQIYTGNFF